MSEQKQQHESTKNKCQEEHNEEYARTSVLRQKCYMSGCKNNRLCKENGKSIPMFRFPTDIELAKFWLGICNRQPYECPMDQTVCKDHFRSENIEKGKITDTTGIVLKKNVIPTANIPNICYSMILVFIKQRKNGNKLDAKEIGVDFTCSKKMCVFQRLLPNKPVPRSIKLCYGSAKKPSTSQETKPGGLRISLK